MNYTKSKEIYLLIKSSDNILLNCHRGPDPDSIGSALALYRVLKGMGKNVRIVCPTPDIPKNLSFLKNFQKIESVNFESIDFSPFDLFVTLDSGGWNMVANIEDFTPPDGLKVVVIDHHKTNTRYGDINLVDDKVTSVGELLYRILEDWRVDIDKDVATCLMTGIIGDTGSFRYPGSTEKTFDAAQKLMAAGADKDKIVFQIYNTVEFNVIKFWGEVLRNVKVDEDYKFIWSAVPYETYLACGRPGVGKETAASLFAQIADGTDFGFVAVEQEKNRLVISFRSRTGMDTSKIAQQLGGGGHIYASGGRIEGLEFEQAVQKLLDTVRRIVDESK